MAVFVAVLRPADERVVEAPCIRLDRINSSKAPTVRPAFSARRCGSEVVQSMTIKPPRPAIRRPSCPMTTSSTSLAPVTQKGGKTVHAWAFEGECDPSATVSNTFTMEWPPGSGRQMEFPEIDRADFSGVAAAKPKIEAAQAALIEELE